MSETQEFRLADDEKLSEVYRKLCFTMNYYLDNGVDDVIKQMDKMAQDEQIDLNMMINLFVNAVIDTCAFKAAYAVSIVSPENHEEYLDRVRKECADAVDPDMHRRFMEFIKSVSQAKREMEK